MKPTALLECLFLLGLVFTQATASTVTTTNDSGPGSLRQAILDANASGGGEITFYNVTGTITLLSSLPTLAANITIAGPGTNLLAVSGNNLVQVFSVAAGSTSVLSGLTIADGLVVNSLSPPNPDYQPIGGAGLSNAGSLSLLGCVITNCLGLQYGVFGNGVYNVGHLLMINCLVAGCHNASTYGVDGVPGGGVLNDGSLTMENCTVFDCSAYYGGGIENEGTGLLTNCIIDSCFSSPEADGGGILNSGNLTVLSCRISNCWAFWGGGMETWNGTLVVSNSSIVGNSAPDMGGGISLLGGTNLLTGCTIANNVCYDFGGGIFLDMFNGGTTLIVSSTLSGNDNNAFESQWGGAACGIIQGSLTLISCTICSNTASISTAAGGGISGTATSQNCIFAGNAALVANDFNGTLISQGFNLIQDTNGCTIVGDQTGNIYGVDPLLGPLQDNGGPTWTHALLPGSPAIDQGSSCGLSTDQRGVPRPYDVPTIPNAADGSDIGAYEWTPPPTACNMEAQTIQNQPLTIPTAKLLLCSSSPMGYALTLTGVSTNSTNGCAVVIGDGTVTYTPISEFTGSDLFTYTIYDGWGGTAEGNVSVSVIAGNAPSSNMLQPVYSPSGVLINFAGIIGYTYSVQRAPTVTGPWVTIGSAIIASTGFGSLLDSSPPPSSAFYRTSYP